MKNKIVWICLCALFVPVLLYTGWLLATECGNDIEGDLGVYLTWLSMAVSILIGGASVFCIPIKLRYRIILFLCYAAGYGIFLFYYTFVVAASVFDNGL